MVYSEAEDVNSLRYCAVPVPAALAAGICGVCLSEYGFGGRDG